MSNFGEQPQQEIPGQMTKDQSRQRLQPLQTGASPGPSTTGISDDAAQTAHDFITKTTRRMSDSQSPRSPGLTDELMQQTHMFWDSTATRRMSHSKHLPDVTSPGMTDQVVEGVLEFVEGAETKSNND